MTGRLRSIAKIIDVFRSDLTIMGSEEEERNAAIVLNALHTAILLDLTGDLAELVRPWMEARAREVIVAAMAERREPSGRDSLAQERREAEARRREDARSLEDAPQLDSER